MKRIGRLVLPATLLLAVGAAAPLLATANDLRSIAGMRSHNRVLLAFAPSLNDGRLTAQRGVMSHIALEAAKRDLLFVQVDPHRVIGAHDDAAKLRRRYHVPAGGYQALLIGKDGNVVLRAGAPIDGGRIVQAIDSMPMRQEEMRRAKAGLPPPAR